MYPELHLFKGITLHTYETLGISAVILAVALTGFCLCRLGISQKHTLTLTIAMTLGFMAGARVFNALTNPLLYADTPESLIALHWGNFSLMGGILGSILTGLLTGLFLKESIWSLGDAAACGVAPGIFVAKLGCFGNGCCFGIPADIPWGVTYPFGSTPAAYYMVKALPAGDLFGLINHVSIAVHPTQIYEGVGALGCLCGGLWLSKRFPVPGNLFLAFIAGFSAVRLVSWGLRIPSPSWGMSPAFYPVLYSTLAVASIVLLLLRNRSAPTSSA